MAMHKWIVSAKLQVREAKARYRSRHSLDKGNGEIGNLGDRRWIPFGQ
jgi:hypothetical protein